MPAVVSYSANRPVPGGVTLSTTVRDALFAHWSVSPSAVADRLPPSLSVDTYEGEAYLGLLAFEMADVGPAFSPVGATFPQVNLRTYVADGDQSGVYFFAMEADRPLGAGLARSLFQLPYRTARTTLTGRGRETRVRSRREDAGHPATVDVRYEPIGSPFGADPGSLAEFLTERYRVYTAEDAADPGQPEGPVYYATVEHEPWTLWRAEADVESAGLIEACGFERPTRDPHLLYSRRSAMRTGRLRRR